MRASGGVNPVAVMVSLLAMAAPWPPSGARRPTVAGASRVVSPDFRVPSSIPPLVFVSRAPAPGGTGVPGLGPGQRALATGGRILIRDRGGRIRELLPGAPFFDVSDPAVSHDGRRIAFAAVAHPDSGWRIHVVGVDGRDLRDITRTPPRAIGAARVDDLDPCWIGPDLLCFASTRYPMRAQYADVPATNLFVVSTRREHAGDEPRRITAERNGAEEPALDGRGQIVYSRWWFNRHPPSAPAAGAPADSVNLWHAIALTPDGPALRCGTATSRRAMTAYQLTFLPDGSVVAACGLNLGLWPRPGPLAIQRFRRPGDPVERLAGAALPDSVRAGYSDALGLAAPSACAPAALPDGRVVFSHDPGGRGDFGLWIVRPGRAPVELVNLPGTLELDAAPIVVRPLPRTRPFMVVHELTTPATLGALRAATATFDYQSLGLFQQGRGAPGAPTWSPGTRIRFLAAPDLESGEGDTAVVIRELEVGADGRVDARGLPADVPLFEQLVAADGAILRAAHGPAHVAGFNAGAPGSRSRCVGCHLGHSALPRPATAQVDER